jgi:hypothetical protein
MSGKAKPVMGVTASAPRITSRAVWLACLYIGFPLIGALVVFDIVIWAIARAVWDICIGVWCWV